MVDGVIYMSAPDNAWGVDARDGTILWHYYWKTRGGTHTGNRGMGIWHNNLYLEVHDDYLICLDAKTGQEKWKKEISSFDEQYFSSTAPMVIGDHVLAGTGNDMDAPGFLQSFDPETGERQWIFYTVPMTADDPSVKTWASLDAARHGGASRGSLELTIPKPTSTCSAPGIPPRRTLPGAATAITCTPVRWSP